MALQNKVQTNPTGTIRRFGETGPIYEVVQVREERPGQKVADILLPESSERTSLPLSMVLADPEVP